jgi:hypothetical protein
MRIALAILLLSETAARADMGPSQPGTRFAEATHRIEMGTPLAGYTVVVARTGARVGDTTRTWVTVNKTEFVTWQPQQPLILNGDRRETARLIIVPSAEVRDKSPEEIARTAESIPGALVKSFEFQEMVPSGHGAEIVIRHRIDRRPDGTLEIVRTSFSPMTSYYFTAALISLAVFLFGFWYIRRLVRIARRPRSVE